MKIPANILPRVTFTVGPSQGHCTLRNTKMSATFFERQHRMPFMIKGLYEEAAKNLRKLHNIPKNYLILFFPGGATAGMDAVAWSLTDKNISGLNMGFFSGVWCDFIVNSLPKNIRKEIIKFDYQKPTCLKKLNIKSSLVLLTPNETSHGISLPDSFLKYVWRNKGKDTLIAWDCTSCAGCRALPSKYYDVMLFALQKGFSAGGGTCALILSPRAIKRAQEIAKKRAIPYFLNLINAIEFGQKNETLNTPCNTTIWMFNEACKAMLKKGGIKEMDKLTSSHAKVLFDFALKSTWLRPWIKDKKYRSFTTPTFEIIDNEISEKQINNEILDNAGKNAFADGVRKLGSIKENTIRIACFPFIDFNGNKEFIRLTKTLDFIAQNLKSKK